MMGGPLTVHVDNLWITSPGEPNVEDVSAEHRGNDK